jgi:signal transduction histidine kinase
MMGRKRKNFSIRSQFALIFITLMAAVILLCWAVNTMFLEQYYIREKKTIIHNAYESIRRAAEQGDYEADEFTKELEEVCKNYNITVCVMDVDSQIKYVSQNGGRQLEAKLIGYIFGYGSQDVRVLESGDDYWIQITGHGTGECLEMYGRLTSGISFIMQTPLESVRESANLANRFLAYVGIMGALLGGIVMWVVAYRITKPISQLSNISERMVHLDFEAKYGQKRHRISHMQDEVDVLGENINQLSESLERSISELKTANNELKRDIEKREQIDEMRKEFLANVSHELKTPIALIQGYAEGLQEGINDDDAESRAFYCDVIVDEAAKMNNMVKKLMTLNQLEFGNDVVNMERFDVVMLIRNYIQSAQILTKSNQIEVRMEDYVPVYVWADEFKTEEVFMNYFTNAVNHCDGEKVIDVRLEQGHGWVKVKVFNTGAPIPEEAIPHLWEKFYKVDKARTRAYGGSGVGLSIVKAIMDSMNQQYGVENCADGVMFWFTLETVQE